MLRVILRMIAALGLAVALGAGCSDRVPNDEVPDTDGQPDVGDDAGVDQPPAEPVERGGFAIGGSVVESESYRGRILLTVPIRQFDGASPNYRVQPEPVSGESE